MTARQITTPYKSPFHDDNLRTTGNEMTCNPAILAALAEAALEAIDNAHDMDVTHQDYANAVAAAVLELVTPERLVWREPLERDLKPGICCSGSERIADVSKHLWYRVYPCSDAEWMWCAQFNGAYVAGSFHEACNDRPAAQAAAQVHADAARWVNTPLGKLVGASHDH